MFLKLNNDVNTHFFVYLFNFFYFLLFSFVLIVLPFFAFFCVFLFIILCPFFFIILFQKRGHMASVVRLLELGANPSLFDLQGFSCLHLAAYLGNLPIVQTLISGGHGAQATMDPMLVDRKHRLTPLHIAAYKGHVAVCTFLSKEMSGPGKRGVNVWWGQDISRGRRSAGPRWRKSWAGANMFGGASSGGRSVGGGTGGTGGGASGTGGSGGSGGSGGGSGSIYSVEVGGATGLPPISPTGSSPGDDGMIHRSVDRWIDLLGAKLPPYSPLAVAVKGHQPRVCKVLIDADGDPDIEDGTGKKPYDRALTLHYLLKETVSTLTAGKEVINADDEMLEEGGTLVKRLSGVVQSGANAFCGCFQSLKRTEVHVDHARGGTIQRKQSVVTSEKSMYRSSFLYAVCCCCREYFAAEPEVVASPVRRVKTFRRSSLVTLHDNAIDDIRSQLGIVSGKNSNDSVGNGGSGGGDDNISETKQTKGGGGGLEMY